MITCTIRRPEGGFMRTAKITAQYSQRCKCKRNVAPGDKITYSYDSRQVVECEGCRVKLPLHAIASGPDPILATYTTRCGLNANKSGLGIVMEPGAGYLFESGGVRFQTAMSEDRVTCPGCRLKLPPTEKKILRLMLDYGPTRIIKSKKFEWSLSPNLKIYSKTGIDRMLAWHLLGRVGDGWGLTVNGKLLAATLPKVKEDF